MLCCTLKIQFKIQFSDNTVILSLLDSENRPFAAFKRYC